MRLSSHFTAFSFAALLAVILAGPASAQKFGEEPPPPPSKPLDLKEPPPPAQQSDANFAADTLSDGTRIPNRKGPTPLQLTDAQKAQIRAAVQQRPATVDFPLATAQAAAQFKPSVGAAVPILLQGQTLPSPVIDQIPALKEYLYVKLPDTAVIIDPMNNKVADLIKLP